MRRGEDQRSMGIHVLDAPGCLHAVHHGHFHIEEHHLRMRFFKHLQRLFAVFGFAHDLKAFCLAHELTQNQPHPWLVIADQHAQRFICHIVSPLPRAAKPARRVFPS